MKAAYKRGKLAPERVEALEQIGFTWTTYLYFSFESVTIFDTNAKRNYKFVGISE